MKVSESKCQRAKVNGALLIIMPKLDSKANAISIRGDQRAAQRAATTTSGAAGGATAAGPARTIALSQQRASAVNASASAAQPQRTVLKPKKLSLQEQMMQEALQSAGGDMSGATGSAETRSNSLLDASIGAASRVGVNVSNIVPRKEEKSHTQVDAVDETVFKMSSRVVELD